MPSEKKSSVSGLIVGFCGAILGAVAVLIVGFFSGILFPNYPPILIAECTPSEVFVGQQIRCVDDSQYAGSRIWTLDGKRIEREKREFFKTFEEAGEHTIKITVLKHDHESRSEEYNITVLQNENVLEKLPNSRTVTAEFQFKRGEVEKSASCPVDITFDRHRTFSSSSRSFSRKCPIPVDGSRVSANFKTRSAANSSPVSIRIDEAKKEATASFTLKSGPSFDRWRGWLKGDIVVNYSVPQTLPNEPALGPTIISNYRVLELPKVEIDAVTAVALNIDGIDQTLVVGQSSQFEDVTVTLLRGSDRLFLKFEPTRG